jgi:hypothetical protein
MYCRKCGALNADTQVSCSNCGEILKPILQEQVEPATGKPENYMGWAIAVTIIAAIGCRLIGAIPGIVAIVYSSQVDTKWKMGDYAGSSTASNYAKTWTTVAGVLGVIGIIITTALIIAAIADNASRSRIFP